MYLGKIKIAVGMAIADGGATRNFILPTAPVKNIIPESNPLIITIAYGQQLKSTHMCELDVPGLPAEVIQSHSVPRSTDISLVSNKILVDARHTVTYGSKHCKVF